MTLRLYNTLTKKEEEFTPLDPASKRVTFYSCGPTVYDYAHIGNFRSFLNADVLRRVLELVGYDVKQVMNMTDVGHMTDDELADGAGQDKMQVAGQRLLEAKKAGTLPTDAGEIDPTDPYAVADFYVNAFIEDSRKLGLKIIEDAIKQPELMPRPTNYIQQMIKLVEKLIENDHAYVASDGVVYFSVQSFPAYGELSGNTPDKIRSGEGGRVDEKTQLVKKHPADFMLWKPDASHVMKWPSPWGEGYPGWHLECSVMAVSLLGQDTNGVIDIHSGGEDNIFPHHECEVAQTCCSTGESHFARYWFHTRFLIVENQKMSKSKGNFYTLKDLLAKGASPAAIRLELIKTHYRSQSNFTFRGLTDSQRQIDRWARLKTWLETNKNESLDEPGPLTEALPAFKDALCNDLNISGAIGILNDAASKHDVSKSPNSTNGKFTYASELEALNQMDSVLGVLDLQQSACLSDTDVDVAQIEKLIAQRNAARSSKDWAEADRVRDELIKMGIAIKDNSTGTTWSKIVSS